MSSNGKNKGNKVNGNKGGVTHEVSTKGTGNKEEEDKSMEGSVEESTQIGCETFDEFLDGIKGAKKKTKKKKKKKKGTPENPQSGMDSQEEEEETSSSIISRTEKEEDKIHLQVNKELHEELKAVKSQLQQATRELREQR